VAVSDFRLNFFVITRSLRRWFRQRLILRCQSHIAGKAANRQPIEKCMRDIIFIDISAAHFQPATEFLPDALHCGSGMRVRLIGDCHGFAVAELETQRKVGVIRIMQIVIYVTGIIPKIQPIERVR
jgi:hypothetical protein